MSKWTMSACVALAWGTFTVPLLATAGPAVPGRPAQAITCTAMSTRASLASRPGTARLTLASAPGTPAALASEPAAPQANPAGVPGCAKPAPAGERAAAATTEVADATVEPGADRAARPATWTVRPGDTLSGIAAALAVPGGWPALCTANRQAIGPDPDAIRPGAVLVLPRPAPAVAPRSAASGHAPRNVPPSGRAAPVSAPPAARTPAPTASAVTPGGGSGHSTTAGKALGGTPSGGLPRWLEVVLLAAGVLAATAFAAEPAAALARRRQPGFALPSVLAGSKRRRARRAAARARIILADHDRLIVTYSAEDHTVYVLTPPGEDPQAVLRAARLVLPDDKAYEELAGHLGVPPARPPQ